MPLTDPYPITPCGPVRFRVRPPGSKSITNRALVCAALADGPSRLAGALDSDDTRLMCEALERLGIAVADRQQRTVLEVQGCGGKIPRGGPEITELFVGNSGTTVRFLTAMLALAEGRYRLAGTPRMHQRPIGDLLESLAALGVAARSEAGNGCPPVVIEAAGLAGGAAAVRGDVSSQFLSGLLLAAPYAQSRVRLVVEGCLVSVPYVRMTLEVMRAFGVAAEVDASTWRIEVPQKHYQGREYRIEPDASAASYFFAAAAITGGEVTVEGLSKSALQGDVRFVDLLEAMGCRVACLPDGIRVAAPQSGQLVGIDVDMNDISDTVQTLSAVALFARGPTTIRGVGHIRHKETDRIGSLAAELRKLGAEVDQRGDGLRIAPPTALRGATLATYDDHRMAMSLALVGLKVPGVAVRDPRCTAKTYPTFFDDLERMAQTGR